MAEPEADNLRLAQGAQQDVDLSDETQDFRFLSQFSKCITPGLPPIVPSVFANYHGRSTDQSSIPKRGEKDFEPDGTDRQSRVLDDSRNAMHEALCGERKHTSKVHVEAVWRPARQLAEVHDARGPHFKTIGRADRTAVWLLPEETIYMVERGSLECWWEEGIPMSLQGVYASCLDACGGLERYQVYAYLKRAGYIIQRAPTFDDGVYAPTLFVFWLRRPLMGLEPDNDSEPPPPTVRTSTAVPPGLFCHLFNALFGPRPVPASGPMIAPGSTYRSYTSIYERLAVIPAHHHPTSPTSSSSSSSSSTSAAHAPFRVAYHVWKPQPAFKKSSPPPPDFRIAVVSARDTPVPTLAQLTHLLDTIPFDDAKASAAKNPTHRLKDGRRNVILAIVDSGVTSFLKFADVAFADEPLFARKSAGGRGGKFGGRGGRGGRGRGRGR